MALVFGLLNMFLSSHSRQISLRGRSDESFMRIGHEALITPSLCYETPLWLHLRLQKAYTLISRTFRLRNGIEYVSMGRRNTGLFSKEFRKQLEI